MSSGASNGQGANRWQPRWWKGSGFELLREKCPTKKWWNMTLMFRKIGTNTWSEGFSLLRRTQWPFVQLVIDVTESYQQKTAKSQRYIQSILQKSFMDVSTLDPAKSQLDRILVGLRRRKKHERTLIAISYQNFCTNDWSNHESLTLS